MALDLLPRTVLSPPEAARRRVAIVVGAATGAAALAGIWLRFEDGLALRLVLAATSALFGWLTMEVALGAEDASGAALRALGISTVLGALSTIGPSVLLAATQARGEAFFMMVPFGAFFGAFTGFAYGCVLTIVAAATWKHVASASHDGADRAVRFASLWAVVPVSFIVLVVFGHDLHETTSEWSSAREIEAHAIAMGLGLLAVGIAIVVPLASFCFATHRLARRARWLARVSSGADPQWSIREIGPHDDVVHLPRLRPGYTVLEHKSEHAIYRAAATGAAVAII
jgi:hypothetical protein